MAEKKAAMKAAYYSEFGAPDVIQIGEFPVPEPAEDEVLVKIAATTCNPMDAYLRMGNMAKLQFPHIAQIDYSGVVCQTGANVTQFTPGDRVFGTQLNITRNGCAAEYEAINLKDGMMVKAPESIPLTECGVVSGSCIAAYQGLFDHCRLEKGQRVFIAGGAGGVGAFAVQLAKSRGAYVIASDSADALDFMRELGADEVFDFKTETLADHVEEKQLDAAFNIAPVPAEAVAAILPYIKEGGYLTSTLNSPDEDVIAKSGVHFTKMATLAKNDELADIAGLIDSGDVKPCITQTFTLDEVAKVHALIGQTHGKMLIVIDDTI